MLNSRGHDLSVPRYRTTSRIAAGETSSISPCEAPAGTTPAQPSDRDSQPPPAGAVLQGRRGVARVWPTGEERSLTRTGFFLGLEGHLLGWARQSSECGFLSFYIYFFPQSLLHFFFCGLHLLWLVSTACMFAVCVHRVFHRWQKLLLFALLFRGSLLFFIIF